MYLFFVVVNFNRFQCKINVQSSNTLSATHTRQKCSFLYLNVKYVPFNNRNAILENVWIIQIAHTHTRTPPEWVCIWLEETKNTHRIHRLDYSFRGDLVKCINSTEIYVSSSISNEYIMSGMVRDFYVHTSINFVFLFLSFSLLLLLHLLYTHFWLQHIVVCMLSVTTLRIISTTATNKRRTNIKSKWEKNWWRTTKKTYNDSRYAHIHTL